MSSIVLSRILVVIVCLFSDIASAADEAPKTLRVPVVGLRYDVAATGFARLPETVLTLCPALAPDDNMRGVFWVYASAQQDTRVYYVIGGYGIRAQPEPPKFPRYEPLDLGTVIELDGKECMIFGEAREVFEARYFDEIPQPVLQKLASNLAIRVTQAVGGQVRLKKMMHDQRINLTNISPEISKAFQAGIEALPF